MDSLITAAAHALAAGDPLGALKRVALREDAPSLALRGIAMAQLGDLDRAKLLLRRATRAFGPNEAVARARCVVAEAEVALASRDLGWEMKRLEAARTTLDRHGDRVNAAHARCIAARRLLLIGQLDESEQALDPLDPVGLPPAIQTVHALVVAGIALRRVHVDAARDALAQAEDAACRSRIPALQAEVDTAMLALHAPAARLIRADAERLVTMDEVAALLASNTLVIDACRHLLRHRQMLVPLARRPVLFTLARLLGEAWPADVARDALIARAFRSRHPDETHRARLRVEMGRLRRALGALAGVQATRRGFLLVPHGGDAVTVLAWPIEERHGALLALLADGQTWSSSALALALDASQRSVQRALETLASAGKVQSFGRGRARRWLTPPVPGFATTLLLPAPIPGD